MRKSVARGDSSAELFNCFGCGAQDNQLELWRLPTRPPLYQATLELCRRLCMTPPTKRIAESEFRNSNGNHASAKLTAPLATQLVPLLTATDTRGIATLSEPRTVTLSQSRSTCVLSSADRTR
jgi:hypothetical protein